MVEKDSAWALPLEGVLAWLRRGVEAQRSLRLRQEGSQAL